MDVLWIQKGVSSLQFWKIRHCCQRFWRFKNINVCNGLGAVNVHQLSDNTVFKDYIKRWHDNDCTMISIRKKCDSCMTRRQWIIQKEARSKKTQTLKRILRVSNSIDQRKLIALRKKKCRENRAKNRAKQRVQLLTQSLKEEADKIASIRIETLAEKCSELHVSAAQHTALREIISAASKRDMKRTVVRRMDNNVVHFDEHTLTKLLRVSSKKWCLTITLYENNSQLFLAHKYRMRLRRTIWAIIAKVFER